MKSHGQDFEILRQGEIVSIVRGLPNADPEGRFIGLYPDSDVVIGDVLRGKVSQDEYPVIAVKRSVLGNQVWLIQAYYWVKGDVTKVSHSITIGTMTNSAIQQASPGSTQTVAVRQESVNEINEVIQAVLSVIDQLGLDEQKKTEVRAEAETIQDQLKLEKPKKFVVKECLIGIKAIVHAAVKEGGPAIGSWIVKQIERVLPNLQS